LNPIFFIVPFSPFYIDPEHFPLGKMSAKQLWKAYGILSAVTEVLEDELNHPKNVIAKESTRIISSE